MNNTSLTALAMSAALAVTGCGDDANGDAPDLGSGDAAMRDTGMDMPAPPPPVIYEGLSFPELPFDSKFVTVEGRQMHYYEAGDPDGPVIVLTHGFPSWSYIWRNVIPALEAALADQPARIIAFDLIGFGQSDKLPDNNYSFAVQQRFFAGFMEALELRDIVLVLHDWGSGIGFDYVVNHDANVRALVYFEAMMPPRLPFASLEDGFPGNPEGAMLFGAWRTPGVGESILLDQSLALEGLLPSFQMRTLSDEELNAYRAPFPTPESRWPLWWVPNELPVAGEPASVDAAIRAYIAWLQSTSTPMLQFYASPGLTGQQEVVEWSEANIENLTSIDLGAGIHFLQEDHPVAIGEGIAEFVLGLE